MRGEGSDRLDPDLVPAWFQEPGDGQTEGETDEPAGVTLLTLRTGILHCGRREKRPMTLRKPAEFSLAHRQNVSGIAEVLAHQLGCESWYVVCHREHQFVIHLTQRGADRYAVSFECTPPADKGIYHGSLTSQFCIIPLGDQDDLSPAKIDEIKSSLAHGVPVGGAHA